MKNCFLNRLLKWDSNKYRQCLYCFTCILWLSLLVFNEAHASEIKGRIIVVSGIVNEQTHAMAKEVLHEGYRRIGYDIRIKFFPGRRSLESANMGHTDGDIARIAGTEKKFTNLIPVATPIIYFQGAAFTKSVTRKINSWRDLKGLRIGIIRGIRYSTIGTKGLNPFFAEDMTHLFKLLDDDRIQVAIAVLNAGKVEIHKKFNNSGIHVAGTPLYSAPLYHFVHKKNEHLIDDLNRVLKDMARQGEIDKILNKALQNLLNN